MTPIRLDLFPAQTDPGCTVSALLSPSRSFLMPAALVQAFSSACRARRVTVLLAATALMCLGDLALTLTYITSMGMVETNPIARAVMASNSPGFVVLWKLATMVLGLGILFWARRTKGAEIAAWLCYVVMCCLCVHWSGFAKAVSDDPLDYSIMASAEDPRWVSMTQ
jgi:hypothetical protein